MSSVTNQEPNEESGEETAQPVKRLCNEIQLFDLCDLSRCGFKEGQFCTDELLLKRFEAINDVERSLDRYDSDQEDDDLDQDEFDDDEYQDDDLDDQGEDDF